MARIRSIKPELFASMSAKGVSLGARWLFAGLFCEADDEGRMLASPRKIAGNVYPEDPTISEDDVSKWLDELEASDGTIVRYIVAGVRYLCIPKFNVHQRISKPTPSRLPPPPGVSQDFPGKPTEHPEISQEDLGSRILDLGSGSGSGSASAPEPAAAPDQINRGRQNPDAPPPLPGALLPKRIGMGGVGFMENPADAPQTVEELLQRHGPDLAKAFPMLDGKTPRPTIETAVRTKWSWYLTARGKVGGGHINAFESLKVDLGKIAREHTFSWERDRGTTVESKAIATTKALILAPIEQHPADAADAVSPEEVRALFAGLASKKTAKVST